MPKKKKQIQELDINLTDKILLALAEVDYFVFGKMTRPVSLRAMGNKDLSDYYHIKNIERMENKMMKKRIQKTIHHLKKAGYLGGEKNNYQLTPKGWLKFITWYGSFYKKQEKEIKNNNENKIFIIIFDVPEKYRKMRDLLRKALYQWEFEMIQKSVFLTRNKQAFKFIQKLIAKANIKPFVKFIAGNYLK